MKNVYSILGLPSSAAVRFCKVALILLACFSIFAQEPDFDHIEDQQPQTPAPSAPAAVPTTTNALQSFRIGRDLEDRNRFDEANNY